MHASRQSRIPVYFVTSSFVTRRARSEDTGAFVWFQALLKN